MTHALNDADLARMRDAPAGGGFASAATAAPVAPVAPVASVTSPAARTTSAAVLRQRLAEAERREAETPEALRAKLSEAETREAEVRNETALREADRQAKIRGDVDQAGAALIEVDTLTLALRDALSRAGESINRLQPVCGSEWAALQSIRAEVVPRIAHLLSGSGFRFGGMAFYDGRTLADMLPRAWLFQLTGVKDDKAA